MNLSSETKTMSCEEDHETKKEDDKVHEHDQSIQEYQVSSHHGKSDANNYDTTPHSQEVTIKNKYGGLLPKKPPLISKDHEHAFFDSADWALGKQAGGQKPKGPLEALRPKLQPTPHHQSRSRRGSTYALSDNSSTQDEANTTDDHDQNILLHDSIDIDIDEANVAEERNCYHESSDHTGAPAAT